LDFNIEREHEDLQDILTPHSIHELGYEEDDDELSASPGPMMDDDDKELPSESEEEDELEQVTEDDYSKDKSVFVRRWSSQGMSKVPHWNHLGIEPISKRFMGTDIRWVVNSQGDILFRHQTSNQVDTQAGFQKQFDDAGHKMPIKEEISETVSGKKTIKALHKLRTLSTEDEDSDQFESLDDFPDEVDYRGEGMDLFARQQVSSSNPKYDAIHQANMRTISSVEVNNINQLIPMIMTTTAMEGTEEFKGDCITISEQDTKFKQEWYLTIDEQCKGIITQQEILDLSANDIVLAKWSRRWNC